jgi:hypothetical protein
VYQRSFTPAGFSDLIYVWAGARAWLAGRNPYAEVGYHQAFPLEGNLLYPAPALVAALPLTPLSSTVADAIFVGVSAAVFALVLAKRGFTGLAVLGSFPFLKACASVQWSPLLTAATLVPALGGLLVCKPTVGLALGAYSITNRRWLPAAIAGGMALTMAAFAIQPDWPARLLEGAARPVSPNASGGGTHLAAYHAPVALLPAGPLLLLAFLRWRRPEARLLGVLACVPHTMAGYELVPLLALVPATPWQATILAALSWGLPLTLLTAHASYDAHFVATGQLSIWVTFLPALLMILRRKNEGEMPAWVDRLAARLGGRSSVAAPG